MGRKNSGIRLRYEVYNVFNEVQFTNLNAAFTFTRRRHEELGDQQREHRQVHGDRHRARGRHHLTAGHGA